ncbi:hypothetical protein C0J52_03272 [Blattella germanica]|nr:hypothetical protein C0J52_03272 [Blattella germanica]
MMKLIVLLLSISSLSMALFFGRMFGEEDRCKSRNTKITCEGKVREELNRGYISHNMGDQRILEISNSDILDLKAQWTKGRNSFTWLKVNFNEKLNRLSNDSFIHLQNLERLDLSHNNISSLDIIVFFPLLNLTTLAINYNKLIRLQTGLFSRQRHLKVLKLDHNNIKTIDSVILNSLMDLETLWLNNNELESLDGRSFMSLENLKILDLSSNHLKILQDSLFSYQKKLETLNLNMNNFTVLNTKSLTYLHKLKTFTFRNNKVSTIHFFHLKSLAQLSFLDLSGNLIDCDCAAKNFFEWSSERALQLNLSCKPHKGRHFINASEYISQMDCSIAERPSVKLLAILSLLLVSVLVDIFVSWLNYRYDLRVHRAGSSESVNEYDYVDNFKDLEAKISANNGMRDSGRYQSVLQKVMSIYDYLRPLPGRRFQDDASVVTTNPSMPDYEAPPIPPREII